MSLTYTQLKTLLQDYLQQYDTTLTADIGYIVKQAEDYIHKAILLPNFRKAQDSTLTGSNRFLAAPSDFIAPLALVITEGGLYTPLLPKEVSAVYEMYPNTTLTGQPKYYALWSDSVILIAPTPDQNYSVEFEYFYKPTSLVDTADPGTTWLSQNAEHALFYACLREALQFQKAEADLFLAVNQELQRAMNDLRKIGEGMNETDAWKGNELKVPLNTTTRKVQ